MGKTSHAAVMLLLLLLIPSPKASDQSFDVFFPKFEQAVQERDTWALTDMMDARFQFFQTANLTPEEVFVMLDSDDGWQWANLDNAVLTSPIKTLYDVPGKQRKALACTPTVAGYDCLVIFEMNEKGQWLWKSMIMQAKE